MVKNQRKTKKRQKKHVKSDGLGAFEIQKIIVALRKVWAWSYSRKLCIERATAKDTGIATCESCKSATGKVYADHIEPLGAFDSDYIRRMWCPSSELKALCKVCHQKKTNEENRLRRMLEIDT